MRRYAAYSALAVATYAGAFAAANYPRATLSLAALILVVLGFIAAGCCFVGARAETTHPRIFTPGDDSLAYDDGGEDAIPWEQESYF